MKAHPGFTILEALLSVTLWMMVMGIAFPGFMSSLKYLTNETRKFQRFEMAVLTATRLEKEAGSGGQFEIHTPQELWIHTIGQAPTIKRVKFEQGILRFYDQKFVYPITAKGDARSLEFVTTQPNRIFMQWDSWKIPLLGAE